MKQTRASEDHTRDRLITRQRMRVEFAGFEHSLVVEHRELQSFISASLDEPCVVFVIDHPISSDDGSARNFNKFLDSNRVLHCFAENWIGQPHPKLTLLPCGFRSKGTASGQETDLLTVASAMTPCDSKPLRVLCNAHFAMYTKPRSGYRDDRGEMYSTLRDRNEFIGFSSKRKHYKIAYRNHHDFAFELCPEGNGLDTHRFYEAIALQTIPIVRRNPLTQGLYERHYPVVVVEDWEEVTREKLAGWREREAPKFSAGVPALWMEYWLSLGWETVGVTPEASD